MLGLPLKSAKVSCRYSCAFDDEYVVITIVGISKVKSTFFFYHCFNVNHIQWLRIDLVGTNT